MKFVPPNDNMLLFQETHSSSLCNNLFGIDRMKIVMSDKHGGLHLSIPFIRSVIRITQAAKLSAGICLAQGTTKGKGYIQQLLHQAPVRHHLKSPRGSLNMMGQLDTIMQSHVSQSRAKSCIQMYTLYHTIHDPYTDAEHNTHRVNKAQNIC